MRGCSDRRCGSRARSCRARARLRARGGSPGSAGDDAPGDGPGSPDAGPCGVRGGTRGLTSRQAAAPPVAGVRPSADAWAEHNGCGLATVSSAVTGGTCKLYVGCPEDGQVELCTFTAMGHCCASGPGLYGCSTYAEATKLEWQFWKRYAW
jgi:poly(3-hydroxybutyrate) depolymerase